MSVLYVDFVNKESVKEPSKNLMNDLERYGDSSAIREAILTFQRDKKMAKLIERGKRLNEW